MGRKAWLIVTLIIAVIFIGYGYTKHVETAQYYRGAFNAGEKAIESSKYMQAENHFRDALKKKPNDKAANAHLTQVVKYRAGLKWVKKGSYTRARQLFHEVTQVENGSQTLVRRAASNETELKEVLHELDIFEKNYQRAKILATNYEYTASNTKLAVILGYGNIDQHYYDEIRKNAKKLQSSNDRVLAALGYHVTGADSSSSDTDENTLLPRSQGTTSSGVTSAVGKITKKQLQQARRDLDHEGVDSKAFTDRDVREVITRAREQNVSVREIAREFK
ncbi:hypothetical protein [Liquorilactobacillus satsumensis]|uniref:hypothetical protein n=1 Tax=Liquorilactobacillus satsumensis TaxID=259059 RepID=UPI0039EB7416